MQLVLSNNQYKYLDNVLMKYRHLPSRIARRKLEIETEHNADINIGASKTNRVNKRTEWLIERFDSDIKLKGLECQLNAVKATMEVLDEAMSRVFELRWIHERTPEEIAELTGASEKTTRKRLERIVEIFADYWGWT
ncbi:sigma factor-like helix-turn-helix DNA-binding protein [Streptococcus ruminantium]|uniref:Sigma factor-like helix-turn-helix DNA-binding protein n=1 Tax=Streptococcus ruminantium TaxID=1917441 RepID=A0ABU1B5P1_9STRE|nr:sigma factor-like helix-turn-helix DNA-binding protein [Streptococcus ruminantium]MDQ8765922.1 sigma factor-like helix-turn-helix DNA-binding protein [Streptococcus ruminantium]MDQ8766368.1 sigma factor-like helix-turn-helix DNA-binding protein [Streptococcus ruminantium]MDQ8769824.1 sigma factor-like helix-turn-helix DNA-binding protein [Streptococcus ruminantium]MDQ8780815.1 sigma factor-like helix-turn-helix DNA-binding protein [Streptococcus ruminantium]MDQ8794851.1 sigma factor-like he